ncbi:MAG: long-chain fatty acid--CoA ligase, partial [Acidimicrobiales bacterium]
GVGAGDVVGLLSYNSVDFLETIFAANHLGAIAMPINWRLAAAEVAFILEHSQARAFVCDDELLDLGDDATDRVDGDLVRVAISTGGHEDWERLTDVRDTTDPVPRVSAGADDLHRLMYTSGTTGRPKGVMITHANLAWKNFAHITELGVTEADVGLACGPLYHVGALDLITTTMIAAGATTVVHRVFDAELVVEEIERSRVTCMWTAPAMVRAILEVPGVEESDLSSVRLIIAGGEKMPIPFIERLRRTFPSAWFADAYGLTETVSGDTFLDRDSTLSKLGSVGRACPYLELEIWDDQGTPVPAGERGEVVLRGPKVFKGYWRDPEATSTAFAGGWFHTGDVGVKDEDGFVYIVDRLKDMIVSGGENIAGSEVERVLYEHDAVVEAAVVGRPDGRWGEVPVAYVVLAPEATVTPDELIEHCREQLAKFKVPKAVTVIDALPRNPSGKVLKRELRDQDA